MFVAARARGIPILVFLKRGGSPDDKQEAFIAKVSGYVDGRFRKGFADVGELLAGAGGGLNSLSHRAASALTM